MPASLAYRDIKGGLVAATSCLAFSIGNGAVIYSGTFQPMLGKGIAAGLVTTAIVSFVLAFASTFRPLIATANSTTAAPLGAIMATVAPNLGHLSPDSAVATVYMVVGVATLATGLTLIVLGSARLGKIVRFIPFPVVAGFLGVTGAMAVLGGIRVGTDVPMRLATILAFTNADKAELLGLVSVYTILLMIVAPKFKHPLALPGILVASIAAVDITVYATGYSVENPPIAGLFLAPRVLSVLDLPLLIEMPGLADWSLVWPLFGSIAAYIVLVVMATLLTSTGLEAALNVDSDYNQELRAQGAAFTASALFGGFVGNPAVGPTAACNASGAHGRLAGVTNGLAMLAFLFLGMRLLPFIPKFVIGGLLASIGLRVIYTWCVATRAKMPLGEWLLVVGIVGVTVWAGLVPAIISGLLGGCIVFALDVSRVDIVRRSYGLDQRASPLVRPSEELAILSNQGRTVRFVELNGTLFFGSAYQILLRVKQLIAVDQPRLIVLDLSSVLGCDSSTTATLARMRRLLAKQSVDFAVAGGDPRIVNLLKTSGSLQPGDVVYATRDQALEAAEAIVLTDVDQSRLSPRELEDWLAESLGSAEFARRLLPELECDDYEPGFYICRQGDPTDTLLFIEKGRVSVMIGPQEAETCARIFGPHTIAGEHAFVLRLPRSASLKVEKTARVWKLAREKFDRLQVEDPNLVIALLRDVVRLQSERLAFATRQNATLT